MNNKDFIPYSKQYIDNLDIEAVTNSLSAALITRGEKVHQFEEFLATFCRAKYAVVFNSGTSALHAAYYAAETCRCDKVITSSNTFVGTIAGATHYNAEILFTDIDVNTGNMHLESLQKAMEKIPSRGKFIIVPVHFAGIAIDMKALTSLVSTTKVVIIEDGAHALGSCYPNGDVVGSCTWSDMTAFSFHPAKIITTGEGGAITTNNDKLYERLKLFRNNCITKNFTDECDVPFLGYYQVRDFSGNYHMNDFQAALGISQMKKISKFAKKRRTIVEWYRNYLKSLKYIAIVDKIFDKRTAYHLFFLRINFDFYKKSRKEVIAALSKKFIGTQVHYIPMYLHHATKKYFKGDFPQMNKFYKEELSLPLHYSLEEKNVKYICHQLTKILESR